MMTRDIIPVVIGLTLCSASAVLLYIWYKTKDKENDGSTQSSNVTPKTKGCCTIPNSIVPLIVGRNEANIKSIERSTNTKITFKVKDDNNQTCEIIGTEENVKNAIELIRDATPKPNVTEVMEVPQSACGKIIGRCGEALQEICRKSQAKVHVNAGDHGDGETRRICITGTVAHVNLAKSLIEEKIRFDKESRKNAEFKREPRKPIKPTAVVEATTVPKIEEEVAPPKREKLIINNMSDNQLEVYVSAVASPSRFWIQLAGKQCQDLDKLIDSMTKYYDDENNQKYHKIADPFLGQIVAAIFKYDSKWYRAEIIGIHPNEYNPRNVVLDLYFVDFGDSEYVEPSDVFELRADFLPLRFQAIECFLANVKPKNKEEDDDEWDKNAVERFEDLTQVARWQKMNARVITTKVRKYNDSVKREGSPVPGVHLFHIDKSLSVADELVSEGLADNINTPSPKHQTNDPMKSSNDSQGIEKLKEIINVEDDKLIKNGGKTNNVIVNKGSDISKPNAKTSSKSFIDIEKQNGNKITNGSDSVIDRNSNHSLTMS